MTASPPSALPGVADLLPKSATSLRWHLIAALVAGFAVSWTVSRVWDTACAGANSRGCAIVLWAAYPLWLVWRAAKWLVVDPLTAPIASLWRLVCVSLVEYFAALDPATQLVVAFVGGAAAMVVLSAVVIVRFVRSIFRPDPNSAPLVPRRWLRHRQEALRQVLETKGEHAFPPLPSVPGVKQPFLIEYEAHSRAGEMRGWLWVMLGSDYDGTFSKTWPPLAETPDAPARRWYCTLRLAEGPPMATSASEEAPGVAVPGRSPGPGKREPAERRGPVLVLSEVHPDAPVAPGKRPLEIFVDLTECEASIYREGQMADAYVFQKRGPVLLSHPRRTLLGSDRALCLFAYNAALKEQWFRALQGALDSSRLRDLGAEVGSPVTGRRASEGLSDPWSMPDGSGPDMARLEGNLPGWFTRYVEHLVQTHPGYFPAPGQSADSVDPASQPKASTSRGKSLDALQAANHAPGSSPQPPLRSALPHNESFATLASGYVTPARPVRAPPQRFTFGLRRIPGIRRWFDGGGHQGGIPAVHSSPAVEKAPDTASRPSVDLRPQTKSSPGAAQGGRPLSPGVLPDARPAASSPGGREHARPAASPPAPPRLLSGWDSSLEAGRGGAVRRFPVRLPRESSAPDLPSLRPSTHSGPGLRPARHAPPGDALPGRGKDLFRNQSNTDLRKTAAQYGVEELAALPAMPDAAKGRGLTIDIGRLMGQDSSNIPSGLSTHRLRLGSRFSSLIRSLEAGYAAVEHGVRAVLRMTADGPVPDTSSAGDASGTSEGNQSGSASDDASSPEGGSPRDRRSAFWGSLGGSPRSLSSKHLAAAAGRGTAPSESGSLEAVSEDHLAMLDRELDQLWFGGEPPGHLASDHLADPRGRRHRHHHSHSRHSGGHVRRSGHSETKLSTHRDVPGMSEAATSSWAAGGADGPERQPVELASQLSERLERIQRERVRSTGAAGMPRTSNGDAGVHPKPGIHASPGVPVAYGAVVLNMLAARMWFDIMRSERIESGLGNFFQKQLDKVPLPPYVGGLNLVTFKIGSSSPVFSNVELLASGGMKMRMRVLYRGEMRLAIQTKLDLRETGAWMTFNRFLNAIQGNHPDAEQEGLSTVAEDRPGVAPDAHDGQPNPGPQQHAVLRLLGRLGNVLQGRPIRRLAANQARRIGNMISSNIGKLPLQLSACLEHLEGNLVVWIGPPPTNRLWYGFEPLPALDLVCTPLVDGLPLKNKLVASRIAHFFRRRLTHLIFSNFVLPNCEGINLPGLIGDPADALLKAPPVFSGSPTIVDRRGRDRATGAGRGGDSSSEDSDDDLPAITPPSWGTPGRPHQIGTATDPGHVGLSAGDAAGGSGAKGEIFAGTAGALPLTPPQTRTGSGGAGSPDDGFQSPRILSPSGSSTRWPMDLSSSSGHPSPESWGRVELLTMLKGAQAKERTETSARHAAEPPGDKQTKPTAAPGAAPNSEKRTDHAKAVADAHTPSRLSQSSLAEAHGAGTSPQVTKSGDTHEPSAGWFGSPLAAAVAVGSRLLGSPRQSTDKQLHTGARQPKQR